MQNPRGSNLKHRFAPKAWRQTSDITGNYNMDASIERSRNAAVPSKLRMYLLTDEPGYGPRTGYDGYSGYSGDD